MRNLGVVLLVAVVVALQVSYHTTEASWSSCVVFFWNRNSCAVRKIMEQYYAMRDARCINCDKYFHCQGNYNAVNTCSGSSSNNLRLARATSDCREYQGSFGADPADSAAAQVANRYGQSGLNCARRYLCSANCAWSPSRRTCSRSNC